MKIRALKSYFDFGLNRIVKADEVQHVEKERAKMLIEKGYAKKESETLFETEGERVE